MPTLTIFSVQNTKLAANEKRLWKRIWWTLYSRDRCLAASRGKPFSIQDKDSDVENITEEDFLEDGPDEYPFDRVGILFFLHYNKLCHDMGLILSQRFLRQDNSAICLPMHQHDCVSMLYSWCGQLPEELRWEPASHHFWPSLLRIYYQ